MSKIIPIDFGEYLPDQPPMGNRGLIKATNVLPYLKSYQSFPGMVAYSDALTGAAKGMISALSKDGNAFTYCGDSSSLYKLTVSTWTDATRVSGGNYGTAVDDAWEFAKWGERIIATNYTDVIQDITMGATAFAALAGSPPRARHMAVVRDFLVLGNVTDISSGASRPNRVHWCGFDNVETWTPAIATQADYQDLQGDGGWIQKIVPGEYGLVIQEHSIWRMTYVGSPIVFQFDEIAQSNGTPAPNSVVRQSGRVFYLGQDDFYVITDGMSPQSIGAERVYKTFIDDYDSTYYYKVWAEADPANTLVFWAYPGVGNVDGRPNRMLVYNWTANKWAGPIEIDTEILGRFQVPGYSLDDLDEVTTDLDALPYSLDSKLWVAGSMNFAAFDSTHKLNNFTGTALDATLETGDRQLINSRRSTIINTRPVVEQGTGTVQVGARNNYTTSPTFSAVTSVNADGEAPLISEGRYHRFRVKTTGDFDLTQGLEVEISPGGRY
jgi:hypothetical protein